MRSSGEIRVSKVLRTYGHKVELMKQTHCKFDILMDGNIKIEVKSASFGNDKTWVFNIHRNNVLDEKEVDFYVFHFDGVPFSKKPIYALFKAPLNSYSMEFNMKRLIEGKIANAVEDFRKLNLLRLTSA